MNSCNKINIYQIDAFSDQVFKGNPACVVPLKEWLPDSTLLNIAKENAVAETAFFVIENKKNIWLTKNTDNKCIINKDIVLPPNNIEKDENTGILKLTKPDSFTAIKDLRHPDSTEDEYNILCSERWYDWFTIPDYHNGNKYAVEIDSGGGKKCFKPCKFGSILTSDTQNLSAYVGENKNKCINRDLIDNGRLKNTLLFTPYAIIFLFGSTKNDLIDLYNYS